MQKATVLAKLLLTIKFTSSMEEWLSSFSNPNSNLEYWFAKNRGNDFLKEFSNSWKEIFVEVVEPEIQEYFFGIGLSDQNTPFIQINQTYTGSWVADAEVAIRGSQGNAYTNLKPLGNLDEISNGLSNLGSMLTQKLSSKFDEKIRTQITEVAKTSLERDSSQNPQNKTPITIPQPPSPAVVVNFVIDARPMRALTASILKSHKIHLSVAISRNSLSIENLSDDPLDNIKIGLFRSSSERNQWSYDDAYQSSFPRLSAHQTLAKNLDDFKHLDSSHLDLSSGQAVYIDCWIQDRSGIYLFQFFLEQE